MRKINKRDSPFFFPNPVSKPRKTKKKEKKKLVHSSIHYSTNSTLPSATSKIPNLNNLSFLHSPAPTLHQKSKQIENQ